MRIFLLLLNKDILLELRGRESIASLLGVSLLFAVAISAGLQGARLAPSVVDRLYPTLVWLIFLLVHSQHVERGAEVELRGRTVDALLVAGVSPGALYAEKVCFCSLLSFGAYLAASIFLFIFLSVSLPAGSSLVTLAIYLLIAALGTAGFSALSTLLSGITIRAKMRGTLASLLLVPLAMPLLLVAIEATSSLMVGQLTQSWSQIALLAALDGVYITLGFALFPLVLKD